jgi:hypothetical protein
MTTEPKLAPSAPENASVSQPAAQPAAAPHDAVKEKTTPSSTTGDGASQTKKDT